MVKTDITQSQLKEILDYDPETGIFKWKIKKSYFAVPGQIAGCLNNFGYVRIGIGKKSYMAHRLAWLWYYGEWPKKLIDHINHKKDDNRICNLRDATPSQNTLHTKKHRNTTSKIRGVDWHKSYKKWMVRIQIDGKRKTIGFFSCIEEAKTAREEAEKRIFPSETNT